MRYIQKITCMAAENGAGLYALCNDSTVWYINLGGTDWRQVTPIPQDGYKARWNPTRLEEPNDRA